MRIGILGSIDNPYIADLQRAAQQFHADVDVALLRFADLQVGIGSPQAQAAPMVPAASLPPASQVLASLAVRPNLPPESVETERPEIDALIVRSMPIGSLEQVIFRMDCLQAWERRGVHVVNPPRSLEIAIDKWLCLHRLSEAGIDVPPTLCCQTRSAAINAFEILGGDVLVKPIFGGEGRGILRVTDKDMAWRVFGTLQQLGQVLYVQQFIDHFGYDVRVLFVGEHQFCIRRIASHGGWRTNIAQGSAAEPHTLTGPQQEVALQAKQVVGGSVVGVDLLPCRDGRLVVLEVNAVPGWKGLGAALKVDIARHILDHVCGLHRT
jgi:RimK family alpha-L-glutamate ligase